MNLFDPKAAKIVTAFELANTEVNPDDILINPGFLLKGGTLLMAGDTGIGKSWLCLNLCKALVLGEPLFGNPEWTVKQSRVLYVDAEVGILMNKRIKKVIGNTMTNESPFFILSKPAGLDLGTPACLGWLQEQIKTYDLNVVVLDPLMDLAMVEENDNSSLGSLLHRLRAIQGDCALVLTHHVGKKPKGEYALNYDPLDMNNIRGASKWSGFMDTVLMLDRQPGKINTLTDIDNWILDAKWCKKRNVEVSAPNYRLFFNENLDGQMVWHPELISTPVPQNTIPD